MTFSERVLALCSKVPRGKVTTYREIAHALGSRSYRAVGQALRHNEHPLAIPCHRVVASDSRLGGYAGKMNNKKKSDLLMKEGVNIKDNHIENLKDCIVTSSQLKGSVRSHS
ncbi:MAG: MGMT family protein [archaeon]